MKGIRETTKFIKDEYTKIVFFFTKKKKRKRTLSSTETKSFFAYLRERKRYLEKLTKAQFVSN